VLPPAGAQAKIPLLDTQPTSLSFTPAEPVSLVSLPLIAPATTYVFHLPRISTFTQTSIEPFFTPASSSSTASGLDASPVSAYALHLLLSHGSRTSSYSATLGDLVADVRTSFVELAALGRARWGMSGRLPFHLEAAHQALDLASYL
jgi:hypothetical protein